MKIGIALVPSVEAIASLVELQKEIIHICPLRPLLGTEFNLPHITLLQGRFRKPINWDSLISELRDYCREQKYSLEFKGAGLEYKPPGWYFLTLRPNILFAEAHRFVFEHLKDSMFLTEEDWQKDTSGYTPLEKSNYLRYGYRYIGDAFHPHITLGRSIDKSRMCDEANLIHLVELFTANSISTIQKITIYEMGENGSHSATLYCVDI
jgi:2'-5' RNA ligase